MQITKLKIDNLSKLSNIDIKNNSFWQSIPWINLIINSKQANSVFLLKKNTDYLFVEKRKISLGEYGFFVIGADFNILADFTDSLLELSKKEKVLFLQIEDFNLSGINRANNIKNFKKKYYKKFITPYTALVNLSKTEDDILKNMKPKGRYNIKLATKKGVEVQRVSKTDQNIEFFYNLISETTARDGFSGNSLDYYKNFLKEITNSELFLAYSNGIPIAGGIFVFDKKHSIYYYGASTSDKKYRNLMAPYLLQWQAVLEAKNRGSELYDFLGISAPDSQNNSLAGVTNFKLKLTANTQEVSTSYLYINKKIKYLLIMLARKILAK